MHPFLAWVTSLVAYMCLVFYKYRRSVRHRLYWEQAHSRQLIWFLLVRITSFLVSLPLHRFENFEPLHLSIRRQLYWRGAERETKTLVRHTNPCKMSILHTGEWFYWREEFSPLCWVVFIQTKLLSAANFPILWIWRLFLFTLSSLTFQFFLLCRVLHLLRRQFLPRIY